MVMNKDPTWLEAATKALELESGVDVWMTAPELVRLIVQSGFKSLKSDYGQGVRTLRAALNVEAKKKDPKFMRKDLNYSCYFALTKMVNVDDLESISRSPAKRLPKQQKVKTVQLKVQSASPPLTNGRSPSPSTPVQTLTQVLPASDTPTIEIDPDLGHEGKDGSSGFCLPSPLTSLLGAKRIMNMLNESTTETTVTATGRPMREARKRRATRDWENEDPLTLLSNGTARSLTPEPADRVLHIDICHPVPCLSSKVDCVRSLSTRSSSRDPCFVQGERKTTPQSIEINPDYVHKKDSECCSSTDSDSDEDPNSVRLQPTPTSQLLIKRCQHRRRLYIDQYTSESEVTEDSIEMEEVEEAEYVPKRQRRQQRVSSIQSVSSIGSSIGAEDKCPVSEELKETDRTATKPTEQRRHVSTLFSPNSLLLNENLKSFVGMEAFEKLNDAQKEKLILHMPIVDQCNGTRVPGDCFSNSFYSSGLREWSERLALGMFTTEYKARARAEEKRKMTTKPDNSWKEQYYERHYGDKVAVCREESPPPYYPYTTTNPNSHFLAAIVDGYFNTKSSNARSPSPSFPLSVVATAPPRAITTSISPHEKKIPKKITLKSLTIEVNKPSKSVTPQKKSAKRLRKLSKSKPISAKTILLVSPVKKQNPAVSISPDTNKDIAKKSAAKKGSSSPPVLLHKLFSTNSPSSLTRLPAKMSYQEILHNLKAASDLDTPPPTISSELSTTSFSAPFEHSHSVFHDHFALLSKEHVPIDFCFRVTSLPLSLPLHHYSMCVCGKAVLKEHSYANMLANDNVDDAVAVQKSLRLSLPRSLLSCQNGDECDVSPMVICPQCRCLYHFNCSDVLLCQTCLVHQQN